MGQLKIRFSEQIDTPATIPTTITITVTHLIIAMIRTVGRWWNGSVPLSRSCKPSTWNFCLVTDDIDNENFCLVTDDIDNDDINIDIDINIDDINDDNGDQDHAHAHANTPPETFAW